MSPPASERAGRIARELRIAPHVAPLCAARTAQRAVLALNLNHRRQSECLRACFKNRPVRGPGLQGLRILAISRRPRALTRRPPTILKHALNPRGAIWQRLPHREAEVPTPGRPWRQLD